MTNAQCVFIVWLFLGAVTGGCFAAHDPYSRGLAFGFGLLVYMMGTLVACCLFSFFIFLGHS